MGDCMNVSHIGLGKSASCIEGSVKHIPSCGNVVSVGVCVVDIFENQLHGLEGVFSGIDRGGISDISLDCMGKGVHACGGCDKGRQAQGDFRIQYSVSGDQRKIVDGVFMSGLGVCDH